MSVSVRAASGFDRGTNARREGPPQAWRLLSRQSAPPQVHPGIFGADLRAYRRQDSRSCGPLRADGPAHGPDGRGMPNIPGWPRSCRHGRVTGRTGRSGRAASTAGDRVSGRKRQRGRKARTRSGLPADLRQVDWEAVSWARIDRSLARSMPGRWPCCSGRRLHSPGGGHRLPSLTVLWLRCLARPPMGTACGCPDGPGAERSSTTMASPMAPEPSETSPASLTISPKSLSRRLSVRSSPSMSRISAPVGLRPMPVGVVSPTVRASGGRYSMVTGTSVPFWAWPSTWPSLGPGVPFSPSLLRAGGSVTVSGWLRLLPSVRVSSPSSWLLFVSSQVAAAASWRVRGSGSWSPGCWRRSGTGRRWPGSFVVARAAGQPAVGAVRGARRRVGRVVVCEGWRVWSGAVMPVQDPRSGNPLARRRVQGRRGLRRMPRSLYTARNLGARDLPSVGPCLLSPTDINLRGIWHPVS